MERKEFRKFMGSEPHFAPHLNTVTASKAEYNWLAQPAQKKQPRVDLAKSMSIERQSSVEESSSPIGSPTFSGFSTSPPISNFSSNNFTSLAQQPTKLKTEKQFYHTFDFKS